MSKRAIHPGKVIAGEMEFLNMDLRQLAEALDVEQSLLGLLIAEKAAVTPDTAAKLAQIIGSTPEQWLRIQEAYDAAMQA